ncbi:MAG: response regulator [Myxococcales bacterium]
MAPAARKANGDMVSTQQLVKRILVVEDDEDSAELLAETLQVRGHRVAVAHSGADGLELASRFEPEVVFLDLGLPDMDGVDLCPRLRALPTPPGRLVALTGYGGDQAQLLAAGFDRCLLKPAAAEALLAALED